MTLREKVAGAIAGEPHEGAWCFDTTADEYNDLHARLMREGYLEQADAAIATVFDALLSDTAVEAGAEPIAEMCRPAFHFRPGNHGPSAWMPWDETPVIEGNAKARTITRDQIKAAMSALTADDAQTGGG